MKKYILSIIQLSIFIFFVLSQLGLRSQSLAINGTGGVSNPSAMLDVDVSSLAAKKGLLIPRITLAQRTAMNPLSAPAQGLLVYQTDGMEGFYYDTSKTTTAVWVYLSAGSESHPVTVQGGSYTLTAADYCIIHTGVAGSIFTLPAASGATGRIYIIVNHGFSLTTSPSYTFAAGATTTGVGGGTSVQLISDGTVWRKIN